MITRFIQAINDRLPPTEVLILLVIVLGLMGVLMIMHYVREPKPEPVDKSLLVSDAMVKVSLNHANAGANLFNPKEDIYTQFFGKDGARDRMREKIVKEYPHGWPSEDE